MDVKFKKGMSYKIEHPKGLWKGEIKVIGFDREGGPQVEILKFDQFTPDEVRRYFSQFTKETPAILNVNGGWKLELLKPIQLENK